MLLHEKLMKDQGKPHTHSLLLLQASVFVLQKHNSDGQTVPSLRQVAKVLIQALSTCSLT